MHYNISDFINPIKVAVLLTLLFSLFGLNRRQRFHRYVLVIMWINFLTEVSTSIFRYYGFSTRILFLASVFLHNSFWLLLLRENSESRKRVGYGIMLFWAIALLDFIYIERSNDFNYYSFIIGACVYLFLYTVECYHQLQRENVSFFLSNNFLLLFSPLLFFYGVSLMFGFNDYEIRKFVVWKDLSLYGFIINAACVAYYTLVNVYIYRERKLKVYG